MNKVITVTDVVEHAFCPKFTYFRMVMDMPEGEKRRGTVQKGREIHEIRQRNNPKYVPKNIAGGYKVRGVTIYSSKLDLVGKIDYAVISDGGIVLFELKYASPFIGPTLRTQLGLLAMLLEERYGKPCRDAVVRFLREPRKTVHIVIVENILAGALQTLEGVKTVLRDGRMPPTRYDKRCEDCAFRLICPVGSLKRSQ